MFSILKQTRRSIRKFMDEKIEACKNILSYAQNRLIVGIVIMTTGIGIGGGLIISAFVHAPEDHIR